MIGNLPAISWSKGFGSSTLGSILSGLMIMLERYVNINPPPPKAALTIPERIPSFPGKNYHARYRWTIYVNPTAKP